ncbi:MAG: SDR family oxidoreductase [Gammaproteobacteria bacterium]
MDSITAMTPLGRAGQPEDAAGAIFLFCIPQSDFITGEVLTCSGGT